MRYLRWSFARIYTYLQHRIPFLVSILALLAIAILVFFIGQIRGIENIADVFALFQVIIGMLLVPSAIYGYLSAKASLDAALLKQDLSIEWHISAGNEFGTIVAPEHEDRICFLRPVLINKGGSVVNWFMVNVSVPRELFHRDSVIGYTQIVGKNGQGEWAQFTAPDSMNFTFMSHGQVAVYPDWPLELCSIAFTLSPGLNYPEKFELSYRVVTNQGQAKEGRETLPLMREREWLAFSTSIALPPAQPSPVGAGAAESPEGSPASRSEPPDPAAP
jgi:hypothetical protein